MATRQLGNAQQHILKLERGPQICFAELMDRFSSERIMLILTRASYTSVVSTKFGVVLQIIAPLMPRYSVFNPLLPPFLILLFLYNSVLTHICTKIFLPLLTVYCFYVLFLPNVYIE